MLSRKQIRRATATGALLAVVLLISLSVQVSNAQETAEMQSESHPVFHWEVRAREHRPFLWTKVHGTLTLDNRGVGFRSNSGRNQHWTFEEIHTAFLGPHRLVIETYLNRSLHRPGTQHYKFSFRRSLPPAVAAVLAANIGRPVQNDDPDASAPALAVIPARHRFLTRGTNGVLRFRKGGIDYVTSAKGDSRSWRWADVKTLSDPDPYHLYIFGYRDTYTFNLKAPLSHKLFNDATDEIYRANELTGSYTPETESSAAPQQAGGK